MIRPKERAKTGERRQAECEYFQSPHFTACMRAAAVADLLVDPAWPLWEQSTDRQPSSKNGRQSGSKAFTSTKAAGKLWPRTCSHAAQMLKHSETSTQTVRTRPMVGRIVAVSCLAAVSIAIV